MKVVGALLGSMSGSMGGLTASRNRGGQYFRQRVVPVNPNSTKQQAVRSYLAAAVTAWVSTLTSAQRAAWTTYAANTPRTGPLGNEVVLTGQQAYIGAYVPRAQIAETAPAAAPTIFNRGEPVSQFATIVTGEANYLGILSGNLSCEAAFMEQLSDDSNVLLYIGKPVSQGVNFYRGPYQLAASSAGAAAATEVTFTDSLATLPISDALVAGQRRPVRLVVLADDGRTSEAYEVLTTVKEDSAA